MEHALALTALCFCMATDGCSDFCCDRGNESNAGGNESNTQVQSAPSIGNNNSALPEPVASIQKNDSQPLLKNEKSTKEKPNALNVKSHNSILV